MRRVRGQVREHVVDLGRYTITVCPAEHNCEAALILEPRRCRTAGSPRLPLVPLAMDSKRTSAQQHRGN